MLSNRFSLRAATGIAALAITLPASAQQAELPPLPELSTVSDSAVSAPVAQSVWVEKEVITTAPMTAAEVNALPADYRSLPVDEESSTKTVDANGVETITRTRRIVSRAPVEATTTQRTGYYEAAPGPRETTYVLANPRPAYTQTYAQAYPAATYAPAAAAAPMVLDRASWIAECERRTRGRDKNETGSIIGGLLGAIGGGILGNRLWDSERLAGTLIGGGVGGIAGLLIGSLFNGDNEEDLYDCEDALSTYLDNYGQYGAPRVASRVIPAPAPVAYPGYGYGYVQQPTYYQPTQTMVMVPVTTYQQQRVVVRETVREETYEVPGAARTIPPAPPQPVRTAPAAPSPKMIKQAPSPKMIKN